MTDHPTPLARRLLDAAYKPFRDAQVYDEDINASVAAVLREMANLEKTFYKWDLSDLADAIEIGADHG